MTRWKICETVISHHFRKNQVKLERYITHDIFQRDDKPRPRRFKRRNDRCEIFFFTRCEAPVFSARASMRHESKNRLVSTLISKYVDNAGLLVETRTLDWSIHQISALPIEYRAEPRDFNYSLWTSIAHNCIIHQFKIYGSRKGAGSV